MEKRVQYAAKLSKQIVSMFEEDSENYINADEFTDSDNAKEFFHALATMVPCLLYNQLTGGQENQLSFNHIANTLCFEYGKLEDSKDD